MKNSHKPGVDRRSFLKAVGVTTAAVSVPSWLWGCVGDPIVLVPASVRNEAFEAKATEYEDKGPIHTQENFEGLEFADKPFHFPTVTFVAGSGAATVAVEHTMTPGHWIEVIYLRDQDGLVVGLEEYPEPAETTDRVEISFDLPQGTTSVTPFAYCNLHEHWQNDTVDG